MTARLTPSDKHANVTGMRYTLRITSTAWLIWDTHTNTILRTYGQSREEFQAAESYAAYLNGGPSAAEVFVNP